MCGIVAVVRRPGSRAVPDSGALTSAARRRPSPCSSRAGRRRWTAPRSCDGALRARQAPPGRPTSTPAAGHRGPARRSLASADAGVDELDRRAGQLEAGIARIERFLDAEGVRFGSDIEAVNAVARAAEGRGVGGAPRSPPHRTGGGGAGGARSFGRRRRGVRVDPDRAVGARPAGGARAATPRACT